MYHKVHKGALTKNKKTLDQLLANCLTAFIRAGTLDLSLAEIAGAVGISKRMLVHYFGNREALETQALSLLEDLLRAQFAPSNFRSNASGRTVIMALWDRVTEPQALGVLQLVMDISRRAWRGSESARSFYREQQRLWTGVLLFYFPDKTAVEQILQLFQGALLAFLVTGEREPGRRALWHAADSIRK